MPLGFKKVFREYLLTLILGFRAVLSSHFVGSEGLCTDVEAMRDKTSLTPIDWWNFHGGEIPNIQKVGIKILS